MNIQPIIKWTGTKRFVADEIVARVPNKIDTYYEPFIGSGAVMAKYLLSGKRRKNVVCSDINADLIGLWRGIRDNPDSLVDSYYKNWENLKAIDKQEEKKEYYYAFRSDFNRERKAAQFLFLTRTSYNGLVRYNSNGEFNASFHFGRDGMRPESLAKIVKFWHELIQPVEFKQCGYLEVCPKAGDFMFLDPPYFNVSSPIYYGKLDFDEFCGFLRGAKCKWALTLDGKNSKDDRTCRLPKDVFRRHEYIRMGKSSLRRLKGDKDNTVFESLYLNY